MAEKQQENIEILQVGEGKVNEADLVVVGSGLSGLVGALRFLTEAKHKIEHDKLHQKIPKVVVLEADSEKGGRTRSMDFFKDKKSPKVSYGGTWVMLEDEELIALSNEISFFPFVPEIIPNFAPNSLNLTFIRYPWKIIKLWVIGKEIFESEKEGVESSHSGLDAMPLSEWCMLEIPSHPTDHDIVHSERLTEGVKAWFFQIENYPSDLSKLSTYFAAKSVYVRLSNITKTGLLIPKIMRWPNGTGEVIDRIWEKILEISPASEFYPHHYVHEINQDDDKVEIKAQLIATAAGNVSDIWRSKYVIVATSLPASVNKIMYDPPLPQGHKDLITSLEQWDDPAVQIILIFKTQWWNKEHQGTIIYPPPIPDNQEGVYGPIFDLSTDIDHQNSKPGVIRIICKKGRLVHPNGEVYTEEEIVNSAISYIAHYHKDNNETLQDTEHRIKHQLERNWIFDFSTRPGIEAVTYFFAPNHAKPYANNYKFLRENFNRVIFAGSERAERGFNWMEGAVLSGRMAAKAALEGYFSGHWGKKDEEKFQHHFDDQLHSGLRKLKLDVVVHFPYYAKYGFKVVEETFLHFLHTILPGHLSKEESAKYSTAKHENEEFYWHEATHAYDQESFEYFLKNKGSQ